MRRRRERIVDAARTLIFEDGLAAVSMRRVAERADVSVMTLYNLFGSKDDILEAVISHAIDAIDERLAAEAPVDVDPVARCVAVITVSIELLTGEPEIFRPMFLVGYEQVATAGERSRRAGQRAARMQQAGLEVAVEQGLIRNGIDVVAPRGSDLPRVRAGGSAVGAWRAQRGGVRGPSPLRALVGARRGCGRRTSVNC